MAVLIWFPISSAFAAHVSDFCHHLSGFCTSFVTSFITVTTLGTVSLRILYTVSVRHRVAAVRACDNVILGALQLGHIRRRLGYTKGHYQ